MEEKIIFDRDTAHICLHIDDPEVVNWLRAQGDSQQQIKAAKRALKIGVVAMGSALTGSIPQTFHEIMDGLMKRWRAEVEGDFKEIVAGMGERLKGEFDPNREGSLARQAVSALKGAMDEKLGKTPQRTGQIIEGAIETTLSRILVAGDELSYVGQSPEVGGKKKGDWLIKVHHGGQEIGKIVLEVKNWSERPNLRSEGKRDLQEAIKTREADAGILLLLGYNPYEAPLIIQGDCTRMVCAGDEEHLRLAYQLARFWILDRYLRSGIDADWERVRELIEQIEAETRGLGELEKLIDKAQESVRKIKKGISDRLDSLNRILMRWSTTGKEGTEVNH